MTNESELERALAFALRINNLDATEREYRFHPKRKWRVDFAWPEAMLALEVEGGSWNGGRHTRGKGFIADCEKYNEAALMGWRVLRVTGQHIADGTAVDWVRRALVPQGTERPPF